MVGVRLMSLGNLLVAVRNVNSGGEVTLGTVWVTPRLKLGGWRLVGEAGVTLGI